jgi:uncharacterized protein (TIGR02611 family)
VDEPVGARAHAGPSRGQRLLAQLAERRRRYRARGVLFKVAWILAGVLVTIAGVAMLALPGPAFVVIPAGLAMLALQFDWAERALERMVDQAERTAQVAAGTSRRERAALGTAALLGAAGLAAWALLGDVPVLPF